MPPLRRTSTRLLRTVKNQRHATNEDHHEDVVSPTPPDSVSARSLVAKPLTTCKAQEQSESFDHDPVSSGDELQAAPEPSDLDKLNRLVDTRNPKSRVSKEKREVESVALDQGSDSGDEIFSSAFSSSQVKRLKSDPHAGGIHASQKKMVFYGSSQQRLAKDEQTHAKKRGGGFRQAKRLPAKAEKKVNLAKFQLAKGADMFEFGTEELKMDDDASSLSPLSSPPDSPELEEIAVFDLTNSQDYKPQFECICGEHVELFLKEDFEDRYNLGRALNYTRQRAFCTYHKRHRALEIWKNRGYPHIQWDELETRLDKQHERIVQILDGEIDSFFRRRLEEQIASGATKSTTKDYRSTSTSAEISVGYYGPRGQKAMEENIISYFGQRLRSLALTDLSIGSAGVSGGVAGFVQKVLIPEMAVGLVMDDMLVEQCQARDVLAESKEVGEVLNEEQVEAISEDAIPGVTNDGDH